MRILYIGPASNVSIPPDGWGGIEKVIWKHTVGMRNLGHEVDIYNNNNFNELYDKISHQQYEIIHIHNEWEFEFLLKHNIDFIYTSHNAYWVQRWSYFSKLFKSCTMAMPFKLMHNALENYDNKYMIENGADNDLFKMKEKIKGKCVAIGKNEPRKNFKKIVNIIKNKPDFTLHLIGPNNKEHQIANNIIVYPNLSEEEVANHISDAEYLFHLSDLEADCLVVKEGGMSGCKLILSNYCAETISKDISWIDIENFDKCPIDLGLKAYEKHIKNYTWHEIVKNIENGYCIYLDRKKSVKKKY